MANKLSVAWGLAKAAVSTLFGYAGQGATGYGFYGNGFTWGQFNSAADGYLNNDFAYIATQVYLKKMKVAPIIISRVKDEKSYRRYKEFSKSVSNQEHVIKTKEYREKALQEIDTHPLIELLENPNSYQTATEFRASIAAYMKIDVGAFILKDVPGEDSIKKFPVELHVIPNPSKTVTIVYSGDFRNPIKEYRITIDAQVFTVQPEYMIYIKDWNPLNNYQGLSCFYPGRETILTDQSSRESQAKVFQNGGSATLLSDDSKDADSRMSPEQFERLVDTIREKYQGKFNQITATNGAVKAQKIGDTPIDMEILESRKFNRSVIPMLLGVHPVLIGDMTGGTENNVEAARKSLVTDTIIPDQIHISENFEKALLPYFKEKLDISFDTTVYPELQPDLKLMVEVYGKPILTNDEKRALFNYDKMNKHGDVYLVESGYETLDMVVGGNEDDFDELGKSFDGSY